MFRIRVTKALLVPAMVIPISVGTLAFATTASASAPAKSFPVKCTSASGSLGGTGMISGCSDTANTGGSGSFPTTGAQPVVFTWATGKTTTATTSDSVVSPDACAAGDTEYKISGTVTADTTGSIPVGSGVKGKVCVSAVTIVGLVGKFKI